MWFGLVWRSIQHNNTTPLIRMRFSGTSLLGKQGQICFAEIISSFFAQNFCTDRVDILLCSERNKTGGFLSKFGTLAPSKWPTIGNKHPHDSDHAECVCAFKQYKHICTIIVSYWCREMLALEASVPFWWHFRTIRYYSNRHTSVSGSGNITLKIIVYFLAN